jgi:hypothetical protein
MIKERASSKAWGKLQVMGMGNFTFCTRSALQSNSGCWKVFTPTLQITQVANVHKKEKMILKTHTLRGTWWAF